MKTFSDAVMGGLSSDAMPQPPIGAFSAAQQQDVLRGVYGAQQQGYGNQLQGGVSDFDAYGGQFQQPAYGYGGQMQNPYCKYKKSYSLKLLFLQ